MKNHGAIACDWQGDLLTVVATGPFNVEGIEAASASLHQCVEHRDHSSWLRIDFPNNDALGDPNVMVSFGKSYLWAFSHGCRAMALVYSNFLQRSLCEVFVATHQVNLQVFEHENDALAWLETQ